MRQCKANDAVELTNRELTPEGFLVAPGILARTGIQEYLAYELGLDAVDPTKRVKLYRPADEVFHPESIASFENKPITIEHPPNGVNADNWAELAKGEVRDIKPFGDYMEGTLIVKSKDAIEAIQSGKNQLSNGYTFFLDWSPGTTPDGKAYDGVQRNIRGNHLAIVDAARCGSACRISDSQPLGGNTMADANLRKVTVDGIPLEVSETAAAAIDKLTKERDTAVQTAAEAQKKLQFEGNDYAPAELLKVAQDQKAQITELQKDVMTPAARDAMVHEWVKLAADAKRLAPDVTTDGKTCLAIRREVITSVAAKDAKAKAAVDAVLGSKAVNDAEPEMVRAAFEVLAALVQEPEQQANDSAAAASALLGSKQNAGQKKLVGRDAMIARQQAAYRGDKE